MIYLIGGVARNGKSIVRKKLLKEYQISGISTDALRFMLGNTDDSLGISSKELPTHNGPLMWPYLDSLINVLDRQMSEDFVIEGDVLLPEYLKKFKDSKDVRCCYIGYCDIEPEKKAKDIRKNASKFDWTNKYDEDGLVKLAKWGIDLSNKYKEDCIKYNVKFFDTSLDFEKTLEEVISYLMG